MVLNNQLLIEYKRPWKLFTLFVGLSLLIVGSYYMPAPDWDISISNIMAFFTYLSAAWSLRVLVERQWKNIPLMLFLTWFSVDGCYSIYWYFKESLIKSNYFKLAKTADIFHEDRHNRITITSHFVKNSSSFFCD